MSGTLTNGSSEEGEQQLNVAIGMIYKSFEKQNYSSTAEINRLKEELKKAKAKRKELEVKFNTLSKENKANEVQIASLSSQNALLTQSIKELSLENAQLSNIHSGIIASIDKDYQLVKTPSHEGFNTIHIKPNIKFSKPITAYSRNKSNSVIDTSSREEPLPQGAYQSFNQSRPLMKTTATATSTSRKSKLPMNLLSELNKCSKVKGTYSSSNMLKGTQLAPNCNTSNNNFFKNCRKTMSQHDYNDLSKVVREFNSKQLTKQETFLKIAQVLEVKYEELFNEFKLLFFPNESVSLSFN